MLSIFEFENYKAYLSQVIETFPQKGRGQINKIANYLSAHPTLVSQVLNGTRDFSPEQIHKLSEYLDLQPLETDYLILLVQYERAGTHEFKKYYKKKLDDLKKSSLNISQRLGKKHELTDLERSIFYSNWTYLAVWLFCSVDNGQNVESISKRLNITPIQTKDIIDFLLSVGLCSNESGIYKMQSQHIHAEFGSLFLGQHHTNWRIKSLERINDLDAEELMFTSPFSISKKDFLTIREQFVKLIKSTSKTIKDSPAEDIACMNLDLVWIKN